MITIFLPLKSLISYFAAETYFIKTISKSKSSHFIVAKFIYRICIKVVFASLSVMLKKFDLIDEIIYVCINNNIIIRA